MGKHVNRLTALKVANLAKRKTQGNHPDGGGLYLQIMGGGVSWLFRYSLRGQPYYMGLGPLARVPLAEARAARDECNKLLLAGTNPINHRNEQRAAAALADGSNVTFKIAAAEYIRSHSAEWRNAKHGAQWSTTLETYAMPVLGNLSVRDINSGRIVRILEPHWLSKNPTMVNVRGRIERVLDWCKVKGYREGENPALWRGNLDHLLAAPAKVAKVEHHPALPYAELPSFMAKLRKQKGTPARALEFLILTAARLGEAVGATPGEIDQANKVWTVPGDRMKAGKEHRVPLSKRALELAGQGSDAFLFPGRYPGKPIAGEMARWQLRQMGYGHVTVHGMRATFKTWAAERTRFERHVVEAALAHTNGDKVEAAYQRGDMMQKRRALVDAWADFCASTPAKATKTVVPLRSTQ
jgi:integrase